MKLDLCGSTLLVGLPDDIFSMVIKSLSPRDVCNLAICCRALYDLMVSDKVWFVQCCILGLVPYAELIEWRKGVSSYKALCRFLIGVQPLLGIWVHQNPELGNVVYVMPGFMSVVGCRIIPQELGPSGLKDGPILWAPVFEILCDFEGYPLFFLHGRERENEYVYPGSLDAVDKNCNVLSLEVKPRQHRNGGKLINNINKEMPHKICRSDSGISKSQRMFGQTAPVPFTRLAFGDRRKLLESVTRQVRFKIQDDRSVILFPCLRDDHNALLEDVTLLCERRLLLMQMYKLGEIQNGPKVGAGLLLDPTQLEVKEIRKDLGCTNGCQKLQFSDDNCPQFSKKKTFAGYFKNSLRHVFGKSNSYHASCDNVRKSCSTSVNKHAQLHEFLHSGDTVGLILRASNMKLSSYRAWPNMHDSRFALYKLPICEPESGKEYSGLWGGTFSWPHGRSSENKPGKALFFLSLSYEKSQGQNLLIATKILEGTNYVLHPNGSAMFIVNINEPSVDTFPSATDADSNLLEIKCAFSGEGIANGYGFRYPGSKPGSLYVMKDGMLAFVWKESQSILTLQRLKLQELLKKGEQVPALPPVSNFAYLTRSYSNVFVGFSNASNGLSSQRWNHF